MNSYLRLVKLDGTLSLVCVPERPMPIAPFSMLLPRKQFVGPRSAG